MSRRKLCVVCMEEPDAGRGWPGWCQRCSWKWNTSTATGQATWAARRARAFERRRAKKEWSEAMNMEMRAKAKAFDAALEKFKTINGSFTYSDEQWWFIEAMLQALAAAKRKGEGT